MAAVGGGMTDDSDEELLVKIGAGPGAFPEFYRRHVGRVTGMGVRRFDNAEDVADFVATVFLEVLRSAGRFDPTRGGAVAWLYGLAGNVAAGMHRQRGREALAERRLSGRAFLDTDDYVRVEERIDAAARLRQTYLAINGLPEQDRRLLELVAVDGLTTSEVAQALSINPVAARVRLARARRRLRAALAGDGPSADSDGYRIKEEMA
jgi:RNA polymerase sigma factor (sigma-70 family)